MFQVWGKSFGSLQLAVFLQCINGKPLIEEIVNRALVGSSQLQSDWDNRIASSSNSLQNDWNNSTILKTPQNGPNSQDGMMAKTPIVQRSANSKLRPQLPHLPPLLPLPPLPNPRFPLLRTSLTPRDVNRGLGRALSAVAILGQIDSYIAERARAIARKLLLLIDDDSINRLPQEY